MATPSKATVVEFFIGTLVVFAFTGLTIKDTIGIVRSYYTDNTMTYARSSLDNQSLDLLNATICFELTGENIFDESEPNVWSPNLTLAMSAAQQILKRQSIFDLTLNERGDIRNESLDDLKVQLSIALLTEMSNRFGFEIGFQKYENSIVAKPLRKIFTDFNDSMLTKKEYQDAHDFFLSKPLTAHRLQLLIAEKLCRRFEPQFHLLSQFEKSIIDICDPQTSLRYNGHVLQQSYLCLPLPLARFGLTRDFTIYPILYTADFDRIYFKSTIDKSTSRYVALHIEDHRLMLESGYISRSSTRFRMTSGGSKNGQINAVADIMGVFKPKDDADCAREVSQRECWLRCQVRQIAKECDCNPFLYRYLLTDEQMSKKRFCASTDYKRCWNSTRDVFVKQCQEKECRTLCSFTKYIWQFERTDGAYLSVAFQSRSFFYVEYRQVDKTSSTEFYSQIGGIVGLYLGFSGLTIYAFVAFMIRTVLQHRRERIEANVSIGGRTYLKWVSQFMFRKAVVERDKRRIQNYHSNRPAAESGPTTAYSTASNTMPLGEFALVGTKPDDQIRMIRELQEAVNQLYAKITLINTRLDSEQKKSTKY